MDQIHSVKRKTLNKLNITEFKQEKEKDSWIRQPSESQQIQRDSSTRHMSKFMDRGKKK